MNWDDIKIFLEVSRSEKLNDAAKRLSMDSSTVSRRLHKLEDSLATKLFNRTVDGHKLTPSGESLLVTARKMEHEASHAFQQIIDGNKENSGNVRIGVTEAFGNFFIAPQLADFQQQYPNITIDLVSFSRVVKISRNEADIAITVEKPKSTSVIIAKLCDYSLRLYASKSYLEKANKKIVFQELQKERWVSYVDNLLFTDQLSFEKEIATKITPNFRSTSITSQFTAIKSGLGIGVLPSFLADADNDLVAICQSDIQISRSFWLVTHPESKRLSHVNTVWDFLKRLTKENQRKLLIS